MSHDLGGAARRRRGLHGSFALLVAAAVTASCVEPDEEPGRRREPLGDTSQALTTTLEAAADTYLRGGAQNKNQGDEAILRVRAGGDNRALLRFDQGAIASAVGTGTLTRATLELTVTTNGENWGKDGRTVDLHRLVASWTELGATWNCRHDTNTANGRADCATAAWNMDDCPERPWVATPTATLLVTRETSGVLRLDVTADVAAFLDGSATNDGWVLRKTDEDRPGRLEVGSRESSTPPRLVLEIEQGGTGGQGMGGQGGMGGHGGIGGDGTSSVTVAAGTSASATVAASTADASSASSADASSSAADASSSAADASSASSADASSSAADASSSAADAVATSAATTSADASSTASGLDACAGVDPDDFNVCTTDACDPSDGSITHTPSPGTVCADPDADRCNGGGVCDASGACVASGIPPQIDDGIACTVDLCDPATGVRHVPCPQLDGTVSTTVGDSFGFLVEGPSPVQQGVAPGAVDRVRAAGLTGRVLDEDGAPLAGAIVRVVSDPELGFTQTDGDGEYALLVEGGGAVRVAVTAPGYARLDRAVDVGWQSAVRAPDARLTLVAEAADPIDLAAITEPVVVISDTSTDGAGTRTPVITVRPGNTAEAELPGGGTVPLDTVSIRITELTVGESGPSRIPALPPETAYTFCLEAAALEAEELGLTGVRFSSPVVLHVENYLGFPVGERVPVGRYDTLTGRWVPENDGRVIRIVSVTAGRADIDIDGDGAADTPAALAALGIDDAERTDLATRYAPGQSLWRAPLTHFSNVDLNLAYFDDDSCAPGTCPPDDTGGGGAGGGGGAPPDDEGPGGGPPHAHDDETVEACIETSRSTIECDNQVLGEEIGVAGTSQRLAYRSDRTPGHSVARRISGDLVEENAGDELLRARVTVDVAGQHLVDEIDCSVDDCTARVATSLEWDGRDRFGRVLRGEQQAVIRWEYDYPFVYGSVGQSYARAFAKAALYPLQPGVYGVRSKTKTSQVLLGNWDARSWGLGGWSLSDVHAYDVVARNLVRGDGRRASSVDVVPIAAVVRAGSFGASATGPDGSNYVAAGANVYRIAPDGAITVSPDVPGGASALDIDVGPDGSLFFAPVAGFRIWKLLPGAASWIAVAGDGTSGHTGDGGPATAAGLAGPPENIAVGPDGSLYIAEGLFIRRVWPDGIIETLAGTGSTSGTGDGGPARLAAVRPSGIDVAPDGSVVFSNFDFGSSNQRIRRITPDGMMERVAGCASCSTRADGTPALDYRLLTLGDVVVASDGAIHVIESTTSTVQTVRDGLARTLAGGRRAPCTSDTNVTCVNGGPAVGAGLVVLRKLSMSPNGSLVLLQRDNLATVTSPFPGIGLGQIVATNEDGSELYTFDAAGKHLTTRDTETGVTLLSIGYDGDGLLETLTDRTGLTTTVARDDDGRPTAIQGPFGHVTQLEVDDDGWLTRVQDAAGNVHEMTYAPDGSGLLQTFKRPDNADPSALLYTQGGRLFRDTDPEGGSLELKRTLTQQGWRVDQVTAEGRTKQFEVARNGEARTRTVVQPSGVVATSTRDAGDLRTTTLPDGTVVTVQNTPDPRWGSLAPFAAVETTRLPSGLTRTMFQRKSVSGVSAVDPTVYTSLTEEIWFNPSLSNGVPTAASPKYVRTYNKATRTETWTTPKGRVSTRVLDDLGRTASSVTPGVLPTTMSYDVVTGDVASMVSGSGAAARTTAYAYAGDGMLAAVTDALLQQTSFDRDAIGRVTKTTRPDAEETLFAYDGKSSLVGLTPPGKPEHGMTHDQVDLLSVYTPPLLPGAGVTTYQYDLDRLLLQRDEPARTTTYDHDAAGRLFLTTFPTGSIERFYDPITGKMVRLEGPTGVDVDYAFDGSYLASTTWSGAISGEVAVTRDNRFRVASETVNAAWPASFTYDDDSLVLTAGGYTLVREAATGRPSTGTSGIVQEAWTYNDRGELASSDAKVSGAALLERTYTRDKLGRIDTMTETTSGGSVTRDYDYDLAGRLVAVTQGGVVIEEYDYDANGNRISSSNADGVFAATFDDQDRILTYGALTFTHAPSGEIATKTDTSTGDVTTYVHDAVGNLRGVELPDGTTIEYLVDGEGRRVGKKVDGVLERGWLWSGKLRPVAELDASGAVVKRFVYADGVNVPELMVTATATYRLVKDQLGSVRRVVDVATGAVLQAIEYDAWGRVLSDTNPGAQPFGFAGGLYDADTGLVRFGAREYSADVGRWWEKDPVRFDGGVNLYRYANSDSINLVDYTGRSPALAAAQLAAGAAAAAAVYGGLQACANDPACHDAVAGAIDDIGGAARDVQQAIDGAILGICGTILQMSDDLTDVGNPPKPANDNDGSNRCYLVGEVDDVLGHPALKMCVYNCGGSPAPVPRPEPKGTACKPYF